MCVYRAEQRRGGLSSSAGGSSGSSPASVLPSPHSSIPPPLTSMSPVFYLQPSPSAAHTPSIPASPHTPSVMMQAHHRPISPSTYPFGKKSTSLSNFKPLTITLAITSRHLELISRFYLRDFLCIVNFVCIFCYRTYICWVPSPFTSVSYSHVSLHVCSFCWCSWLFPPASCCQISSDDAFDFPSSVLCCPIIPSSIPSCSGTLCLPHSSWHTTVSFSFSFSATLYLSAWTNGAPSLPSASRSFTEYSNRIRHYIFTTTPHL